MPPRAGRGNRESRVLESSQAEAKAEAEAAVWPRATRALSSGTIEAVVGVLEADVVR